MAGETKEGIREQAARRVSALTAAERRQKSAAVCEHLLGLPEVRAAGAVLVYAPLPDEVDVEPVFRALKRAGARTLLPKCVRKTRVLLCVEVDDLEHGVARGTYGILEPESDRAVARDELDVIVVPGRAFDRAGNRLGRGGGYYDRLLMDPQLRALRCGVAFDCQFFEAVPATPLDVPMDAVVTESSVVRPARG